MLGLTTTCPRLSRSMWVTHLKFTLSSAVSAELILTLDWGLLRPLKPRCFLCLHRGLSPRMTGIISVFVFIFVPFCVELLLNESSKCLSLSTACIFGPPTFLRPGCLCCVQTMKLFVWWQIMFTDFHPTAFLFISNLPTPLQPGVASPAGRASRCTPPPRGAAPGEPFHKDPAWEMRLHGGDAFKDPAVVSAVLGMPPGRHVSAGMELAVGQGRPDSY